jgi:hypothetical protein
MLVRGVACILILVALAGCQKASGGSGPKSVADARAYAELPGLARSPHPGLQAELARLRDERMTPLDLKGSRPQIMPTMVPARPTSLGVQAAFREAYPSLSRGMHREQIERIDPDGDLHFGPIEREQLRDFRQRIAKNRERFSEAVVGASSGLQLDPAEGPLADLEFLDPLELGVRIEGLVAIGHLADGDLAAAWQSLDLLLHTAEILASEPHVPCRLLAVNARSRALKVLQRIVLDPRTDKSAIVAARQSLVETLKRWPSDSLAWSGERSSGLITFEMVRDGHFLSLLERDEVDKLHQQHITRTTMRAVMHGIDEDQLFFLNAMRRMIDCCDQPFFARCEELAAIRTELTEREATNRFPIVAARLLDDFEPIHQRQSEDLSRCLAWSIALRAAANPPEALPDPALQNPTTGKPFEVEVSGERVLVRGVLLDPDEPIEVRIPAEG